MAQDFLACGADFFLEGYAAFTRDAPLAGRNLDRTVENLRKDSIWIREISRSKVTPPVWRDASFQNATFHPRNLFFDRQNLALQL